MTRFEKRAIGLFVKYYNVIAFILISILAFLIRYSMRSFQSRDFSIFLSPWFDYLKQNGGLFALKNYPGDYNAPYMTVMALMTYLPVNKLTLIKSFSCIFDYALAFSSGLLAAEISNGGKKRKNLLFLAVYSAVLLLPTVAMNSSLWAQCDSVYTTFVILSLYFFVKEKYPVSFIMLGIAFSFKLQFIFILPLYIVLYFSKRSFSALCFLSIPITNIIMCIPAMICGNSLAKCLGVYLKQTETYKDSLTLNFPNIYNIVNGPVDIFYTVGEIFTVCVCMLMLLYLLYKKTEWNNEKIIMLGLWFIATVTFILPGMHERYAFSAEILAVIYFICYRKNPAFAACVLISPIITYSHYLFGLNINNMQLLSLINSVLLIYFTLNVLRALAAPTENIGTVPEESI